MLHQKSCFRSTLDFVIMYQQNLNLSVFLINYLRHITWQIHFPVMKRFTRRVFSNSKRLWIHKNLTNSSNKTKTAHPDQTINTFPIERLTRRSYASVFDRTRLRRQRAIYNAIAAPIFRPVIVLSAIEKFITRRAYRKNRRYAFRGPSRPAAARPLSSAAGNASPRAYI